MCIRDRRQAVIDRMVAILREDAPWSFGFHPKDYSLRHAWIGNAKPNQMARNTLKYMKVDPVLRAQRRREWNTVVLWPLGLMALLVMAGIAPAAVALRRRERARAPPSVTR